ncbi:MAG: ABC transporter permease, partial [Gemmatimonadaceae bacterium]
SRRDAEHRMDDEMRFHVDMEAERLMRQGLDAAEARRRALVAFGGVERYKEEMRDGRGTAWLGGLRLDLKLGLRMLAKYPGLTVVGVVGMAVAVAIGAVAFALISSLANPAVPLDEGARVVAIQNVDTRAGSARRTLLHDLATWREALTAVHELAAFRMVDRNVVPPEGRPEPLRVAEMTASGFRIARVPPLLGRYFNDDDEREGAPPVVVIGYSLWQARFGGASDVIGRTIRIGATPHTVIGVMPQGFAFPVNNRVWTPLRLDPSDYERGKAPPIDVFGRLANGASLEDARLQLATITRRLAAAHPETHAHVRARVVPYTHAFTDTPETAWILYLVQLGISMLLVVIGTNVAILVYARTASRMSELAVRSALGASRGRIVGQLFAEALVLSLAASAAGLALAWLALDRANAFLTRTGPEQLPFWIRFGISPGVVLYVLGMAVVGAVIVGAVPGLKATRRGLQAILQLSAGGTAMRLGRSWTVMIVAQVALAVATLPLAGAGIALVARQAIQPPAVPPAEWMAAAVHLDQEGRGVLDDVYAPEADDPALVARRAALRAELLRRVRSEPGVVAVTLSSNVPGEEETFRIEAEDAAASSARAPDTAAASAGRPVAVGSVDPTYFGVFGVKLLTGRALRAEDAAPPAPGAARAGTPVVVNRTFAEKMFGGADPLGRRVRQVVTQRAGEAAAANAEPWSEIVGVVADFPNPVNPRFPELRMYRALAPGAGSAVSVAVRVRGGAPVEFGGRLRDLALAVDPLLRVGSVAALDDSLRDRMLELRLLVIVVVAVTLSVLLLSAAGIYALVSFTITRRRREIGIRAALGAGPRQVIGGVLAGAMRQIAVGIVIGLGIARVIDQSMKGGFTGGRGAEYLVLIAALMMSVGALASLGPARRALRIQPTEALKSE